jgi:hypothetical protein
MRTILLISFESAVAVNHCDLLESRYCLLRLFFYIRDFTFILRIIF